MTNSVRPGDSAFTTLWTADQVRKMRKAGVVGKPISLMFGGPHQSAPSFARAGVQPRDEVIPIQVRDGRMMLLSRLRVAEILTAEAFVERHPDWFEPMRNDPKFRQLEPHFGSPAMRAIWQLARWLEQHPEVDAFCPGEATEVLLAADATAVRLDVAVPAETVKALRWQPKRKPERPIKHLSSDGRIERSISLQGIYRLSAASAEQLRALTPLLGRAGRR